MFFKGRAWAWALVVLLSGEAGSLYAQNSPLDNSAPVGRPASDFKLKKKKKRKNGGEPELAAKPEAASVSGTLKVSHGAAFSRDPLPVSRVNLVVSYAPAPDHAFYVVPNARKYYEIDGGENEVDLGDTPIGYEYTVHKGEHVSHGLGLGATVATNQRSRQVGMIAQPEVSYKLGAAFFENIKLSMSLTPAAKYYVKEYKQGLDGTPLPRLEYGAGASLGLSFYNAFSLAVSSAYSILAYEESRYTNDLSRPQHELPDHTYVVGASATLPFAEAWFLTAGYQHASSLEDYGSLEFILFEEDVTQWSVGLGVNF